MPRALDLIVASAWVKVGRLFIRDRRVFDAAVRQLPDQTELELTLARRRATRSHAQNAYYWGVVLRALSDHTGYDVGELHDICKAKFLPLVRPVNDAAGQVVEEFTLPGSTRGLHIPEFHDYVEQIRRWAAEMLDCDIPDPTPTQERSERDGAEQRERALLGAGHRDGAAG